MLLPRHLGAARSAFASLQLLRSRPAVPACFLRSFASSARRFAESKMEAKCNCGAVTVKVNDPELYSKRRGHICHCINCRRTAGSAFGTNLIIETDKVTIDGADNLTVYNDPDSLSGRVVKRFFCKTCGNKKVLFHVFQRQNEWLTDGSTELYNNSPIKSETEPASNAGKVILKLGIFENMPEPEMETFVEKSIGWVQRHPGTTKYKIAMGGEKA